MLKGNKSNKILVLYEIYNLLWNYFWLDNQAYTMFPKEKEVLTYPNRLFKIIEISEKEHKGNKY